MEDRRKKVRKFIERWTGKGRERSDTQKFWADLLETLFDIRSGYNQLDFEQPVKTGENTKFLDAYIPSTKVLIEQKGVGRKLDENGHWGTAYNQARFYANNIGSTLYPNWIVTSNFKTFEIYDQSKPNEPPIIIELENLEKDYHTFDFLLNPEVIRIEKEEETSARAGELIGEIYEALLKEYNNPNDQETLKSLNILCVRLVFCFYAEDAGIFKEHNQFSRYLEPYRKDPDEFRLHLKMLFDVLDTDYNERDPYLSEKLKSFPYVDGGLFENRNVVIPRINSNIIDLILYSASSHFDWSYISPTIFGAAFESTINPETRRSGGMHYTSIENIHKVIDPLFLDDLKKELEEAKQKSSKGGARTKALREFTNKLSSLKFLDPACGSGNFLTETYLSLRRLENEALKILMGDQVGFGVVYDPIKVTLDQFYGIEINDFAVSVAKTALWIAESQMVKETEEILHTNIDFLPLKEFNNIIEGNALRIDWNEVLPVEECNYIMGNPPFVGHQWRSKQQVDEMKIAFNDLKKHGKLDYVCAWYSKAVTYMQKTSIETAFVSTNSIVQGEAVGILWKYLIKKGLIINFAYQSFVWANESKDSAQVHCVIIGFSIGNDRKEKKIYFNNGFKLAQHINGYLLDAPDVFISSRRYPLSEVPALKRGNQPTDNGNLILTEEEKNKLLKNEPQIKPLIRPFMMGKDFINQKPRYCLWLKGANSKLIKHSSFIKDRINKVREFRLSSKKAATRKKAESPMLFDEIRECYSSYLAIPKVSSENRKYIPIGYLDESIIAGDSLRVGENTTLYHFGVITSIIHNAWMRTVAGRLKSDYSYSNTIVYNNFPWPESTDKQKKKIKQTAQAILDARDLYPDSTLADLYDPDLMPIELRKAHEANDHAVMNAYGFKYSMSEEDIVAELMKMYQELTASE